MASVKKAKRLEPTKGTVFRLGAVSGNCCAFPGCPERMFTPEGLQIGNVCHIEAAEKGGPRFNDQMTDEQRRHISNLMLMCYVHHRETDDEEVFPKERMWDMKRNHESQFQHAHHSLIQALQDWTVHSPPSPASNLRRLNRVMGWRYPDDMLETMVADLESYLKKYALVPRAEREFVSKVVSRMRLLKGTGTVTDRHLGSAVALKARDFESTFGSRAQRAIQECCPALNGYGVGGLDEVAFNQFDDRLEYGILIYGTADDWPLWTDLTEFCAREHIPLDTLAVEADFAILDE